MFPPAVRKVVYTTKAIESINARLRKIIKTRGHFPGDDAASKLEYFSPSWTPFQADRGCCFSGIVDGVSD